MFVRILFTTFSFGKNYTTDSYVLLHIEDIINNMHWIYGKFDIHIIYLFYFKFNLNLVFINEPFDLQKVHNKLCGPPFFNLICV